MNDYITMVEVFLGHHLIPSEEATAFEDIVNAVDEGLGVFEETAIESALYKLKYAVNEDQKIEGVELIW